jgi:crossover junction endodeoxyribonuclease RuvC
VLDRDGALVAVDDLPVIRDGRLAWIDADALLSRLLEVRGGRPMRAIVERVHAMPRNGSQAAFSQGATLGSILATLQLVRARIELVTPQAWKRSLGLSSDKSASLDRARLLFPDAPLDRQKDHGRAEALLIAWHAQRHQSALQAA